MSDLLHATAAELAERGSPPGRPPPSRSPGPTWAGSSSVDGALHSFLHVDAEGALAQAAASDERRASGAPLSAWDGVPIAVKDVLATRGIPTTCGSKILEGWVPPYDATVVRRLKAAGLPILGKTNMDEFAMGSSTEHSAYGPTHNPWDLDRIPGGSGGGSAAAVAGFEATWALGTDTGGSIRQPGAVTGTVGVKPTFGGVSRYGLVALANSLDQVGPVTRSVLDAAILHTIVGGHDPRDSTSIDQPLPDLVAAAREGAVRGHGRSEDRHHHRADRRGLPGRGPEPLRRVGRAADQGGSRGRRGVLSDLRARPRDVLPDHAERGVLEPRQVRRHALRAARLSRGGRRADRRGRHARHPRRRLRRRGQAPDHPRHLRAVQRLLRRLLRPGAEGSHPDQPRLRGRLRQGRRPGLSDRADHGLQARGQAGRPGRDVPQRHRHHPGQPRRRPGDVGPQRARRGGRSADRLPGHRARARRRPSLPCRRGAGDAARADAGAARCGPRPPRCRRWPDDRTVSILDFDEAIAVLRPGPRARGPRRAEHGDEDVLRLPDRVRRSAQHPGLPDLSRSARGDAGGQRQGGRVGDPDGPCSQLRDRRVVPLRPEELLLPGHAEELPDLAVRRADRLRRLDGRRGRRRDLPCRDRARPHGGGHRQVAARRRQYRPDPRRRPLPGRLQPRRHPADRDRHQADPRAPEPRHRRWPAPMSRSCAS